MQKEELLSLLQDPEICQEIFGIVRNMGRPVVHQAAAAPAPKTASASAKSQSPPFDMAKLAALKAMMQKNNSTSATSSAPAKPQPASPASAPSSAADAAQPKQSDPSRRASFSSKLDILRAQAEKVGEERALQEQAKAKAATDKPQEKYTFILERPCPVCGKTTRVVKCKSRMVVEKADVDMCIHYKDFNPYLYRVWGCEHCGYAADERQFLRHMPEKTKDKLNEFLSENNVAMGFIEERSVQEAIDYCDMAILFGDIAGSSPNRQARLYLTKAWIYRHDNDEGNEKEAMKKAAELYETSLETEMYPVDGMSDNTATYLTGAIHFMRGDFDAAARHLSRIISNQSLRTSDPKTYERARQLWQDIKSAK